MKTLFDSRTVQEIKDRLGRLRPDSVRQWGTMNPAQAVAHTAAGLEMATGAIRPPRKMVGRLIGWAIKPLALGNDAPMRKNSPTVPALVMNGSRDLDAERARLFGLLDEFSRGGPERCTTHPHPFFGRMSPREWSTLMYKHLDHHLRQFGV